VADHDNISGQSARVVLAPDAVVRLVKDCIAGNRNAQKQFYDTYAPFIYGVIKRYLYNKNAADEILNETFFRVLTKLEQYEYKGSIEGWMRRITINLITDHLRQYVKYENEIATESDSFSGYIQENQVSKLSYKELLGLIHKLPETHSAVFNLYVFEDLAHKEIASLLGISEANSRWYLNDARKRLKSMITNNR
jgi:RNA polymerase sigma-70 factor (ECF subfamily)